MLDTVLPSLLPLDILWLSQLQEGFGVPEILREIFLGDENGELVENFNHLIERNRGNGFVFRRIPGKWNNQ